MCELPWYALAEIYLQNRDKSKEIYCLCSRVFVRNKDDNLKRTVFSSEFSASEEELLIEQEIPSECISLPQILKYKVKQEAETETLSCYCSASHTDNLSTDEHDSLRESHEPRVPHRGLQPSDSGADLTECIRHDIDADWQKFWSLNGEKLIWESWIAKYSAYINPDYLQFAQDQAQGDARTKEQRELLTLDIDDKRCSDKNRILVRNLSGSDDKLFTEVSEGWNPLSPVSVDCETEVEQLLSSRCGSHASSLRTVDSMTNVTRMTISSLDLSQSSHSSDSFSSVSSVQSSLSSTSSEENEDYHHQWDVLWKRHYEDEFMKQYQIFVATWKECNVSGEKIDNSVPSTANAYLSSPSHVSKQTKKNIHKVFQGKVEKNDVKCPIEVNSNVATSLGTLLSNLKVSSEENSKMEETKFLESDSLDEEAVEMAAMGLPTQFGAGKSKRGRVGEAETVESPLSSSGDFESCRKKIKAAFTLIGIEFKDTNSNPIAGQVQYKMKHIRLQNRHLKLRNEPPKPKHIHFDDDGGVLEQEDLSFQGVLLDTSDDKQSSADEEIASEVVTTPPKVEEQQDETVVTKRKKRKKKIIMPPEIKENTHLRKYWHRRFQLFSKFDEGVKLDEESWYSVTPEQIAKHLAQRCKCDLIVDGFCGAGGNAIQFAFTCKRVIAIDIDPKKIELARNNAEVYGVADKIDFIVGDFFHLAPGLMADVVFFSPPWGGPAYKNEVVYDLESMLLPVPISKLLEVGRVITSNIAVFLPKNSNAFLLIDETAPGGGVEIEQNFMKKNLVSITAYYGDLIKKI
ncbi:trimethylguanosine synthase isoform X2 [Tribolium castaneum]|uniref:trimethylguanosine synthase isoform X2 n=1 Tax=Tribolium castaneum TaxID=7070 RepID=UPI0001757F85|nr:PREDICTED: trimethylguanosine synthase isoform X2 [Tribolium castaneum]|eukprot:XP_969535.2 PREDICTED: trimethylguanosine synthase isoform X2 [Tribolium castaneum]